MAGDCKNLWKFVTVCNLKLNLQELKRFKYFFSIHWKRVWRQYQIWVLFFLQGSSESEHILHARNQIVAQSATLIFQN